MGKKTGERHKQRMVGQAGHKEGKLTRGGRIENNQNLMKMGTTDPTPGTRNNIARLGGTAMRYQRLCVLTPAPRPWRQHARSDEVVRF